MPSDRHEFLVELFSSAPEEIREMLRGLGFRVSDAAQASNVVLGPEQLRLITDEAEAKRSVALAVLGVLAHAKSDPETVGRAAVVATRACLSVSNKAFIWCYGTFYEALSGVAFAALEKLMELDVRNLKNEATRRQVAFGKADSILKALKKRRLSVTAEQEERIFSCLDFDTLERWLETAFTASSTDELFTDE